MPKALVLVVLHDGRGLGMEGLETLGERLDVVVRALDDWLAGDVVGHGLLWWAREDETKGFVTEVQTQSQRGL